MKCRSMRIRLALWNVGILALTLLFFLAGVHYAVRAYLLNAVDQRLVRHVRIAQRAEFAPPALRSDRRFIRSLRAFERVRLFNLQGRAVDAVGQPDADGGQPWDARALARVAAGEARFSTVTIDEVMLRVYSVPVWRDGAPMGVAQVAAPMGALMELLAGLTAILLVLAPLALLAAAVGGLFLTNRALRPVREMARLASGLTAEDLSRRLPVRGDDEFAQLASTFNGMIARLETAFAQQAQAVEQERRFIADASHELRTPLTSIKANTSLALRGARTPEQYRAALQATDRAADLMSRLVQDLLLLARSDSGQLPVTPQPVEAAGLVGEALAMVIPAAPRAAVHTDIPPALRITGDPHHLLRLLTNLLENAFRHTPADGRITFTARQRPDATVLEIADTGEGIAPEHLRHLGKRFYRADAARTRQHGGAGLGLAICRGIAEAHGGALTIASTPGCGTTVTVTLPATGQVEERAA